MERQRSQEGTKKRMRLMEGQRCQEGTKKGPWNAEEDEILMKFVKENGPKDWSSIRSKYHLPRSGKSCRLRWVNKLRPNLKIGCKFTEEEESVVVDMQKKNGNKWAKIATFLNGRTDNDVKNFWSSRKKRLAKLKGSASSSQPRKLSCNKMMCQESSSNYHLSSSCFFLENSNTTKDMMPHRISSLPPLVDAVGITPLQQSEYSEHSLISQLEGVGTSSFQEIDFMEFSAPNYMEMPDFGLPNDVGAGCEVFDKNTFGDLPVGREVFDKNTFGDLPVGREVFDKNTFGDLPVDWFDLPESFPK